ncbi:MAG TPA: energy transducer TonB, partial [Puia sp.]|nr:energy transducer TonB [Puia sp.]
YDLRKTYNRRLTKALAATASLCLLLIGGYTWAGKGRVSNAPMLVIDDSVFLVDPVHEQPVLPPPPVPKPQVPVATIQSTTIRIVPDEQVRPQDVPPPSDIPDDVRIGTSTHDGELSGDIVEAPSGSGVTQGVIEPPKKPEEDETIYTTVEIESSYPGGTSAWIRFLKKNYTVPEEAIDKNISGTVIVQFIVNKEGNVSDVKAVSGPELLSAEAVCAISKSGKWTPAIMNGRKVNSYKRQPIVVRLTDQ